jgi:7-carboxy-7-deazaguanine synthase
MFATHAGMVHSVVIVKLQLTNKEIMMKVANIYRALNGEVTYRPGPGSWTTIVRLGGCNLRCWRSSGYCDAPSTLDINYKYPELTISEVLRKIDELKIKRVLITGGEPLLQREEILLLAGKLNLKKYVVTLETSGSIFMSKQEVAHFSSVIADVKTPGTEMHKHNKLGLFANLGRSDFMKFVIQDRDDYEWSLQFLSKIKVQAQVAFGPRWGYIEPRQIVEWLEEDERFDIMLNLQLHKYVFPESITEPTTDLKALYKDADRLKQLIENDR